MERAVQDRHHVDWVEGIAMTWLLLDSVFETGKRGELAAGSKWVFAASALLLTTAMMMCTFGDLRTT